MEFGAVSTSEKHADDAKGQPKVRAAITKHLRETKKHATAMKQALSSPAGGQPVIREGISKIANLFAGIAISAAKDTTVKNSITDLATEHFEIACYTSLTLTATELGEKKIAATCKAILKEEQAMANTLKSLFPSVNSAYLATLDDEEAEKAQPEGFLSAPLRRRMNKA